MWHSAGLIVLNEALNPDKTPSNFIVRETRHFDVIRFLKVLQKKFDPNWQA